MCSNKRPWCEARVDNNASKPFFPSLRNIAEISDTVLHGAENLVHAFITSRLNCCNTLLSGCSSGSMEMLRLVQNAQALPESLVVCHVKCHSYYM